MTRAGGRVFAMIATSGLLLASCGDGDDDGGSSSSGGGQLESGSDYSVAGALAEIPADVGDDAVTIRTADLVGACEAANDCDRPDEVTDGDAVGEWLSLLDGYDAEGQAPIVVPLPESFGTRGASVADFQEQVGWSVLDVDAFVGVEAPPGRFTVVAGDGVGDLLSDDLAEVTDGIVSTSDAEDLSMNPADRSPADRMGRPVRFAGDGDTLASSLTTPELEAWVDGPGSTLADDEPLSAVSETLDAAGVTAAVLDSGGEYATGTGNEDALPAAFDAIGFGWAADDEGESVVTIAYHHASAEDAEANATELETLFTDGTDASGRPMSDMYTVDDAGTDDSVATVTIRPEVPSTVLQAYIDGGPPFTHA